jgi:aminocarboxymuconate-semialdehyde decarboxylase
MTAAGPEQVLLGSDYPFDMGSDLPVDEVQAAGLSAGDEAQVLGGNARTLGITAAAALTARHKA